MTRVLSFMAHPDDTEILVGGTLFHLKAAGWEVGIATMTSGDRGSATHAREEISRLRFAEAQSAAAFLGGQYYCAGLLDMEVFATVDNMRRVVEVMRAFAPDVVITHSPVDYMLDHEEAARLVRTAAFAVAMPLYDTLQVSSATRPSGTPALYYADSVEGLDYYGKRIYPDFYVNIANQIENKRQMLARHSSQREWLRSHHGVDEYLDRMTGWAKQYGSECGFPLAEGFRQHLGHGYPHDNLIQSALARYVKPRA